jgi:uncharacterized membrane protein
MSSSTHPLTHPVRHLLRRPHLAVSALIGLVLFGVLHQWAATTQAMLLALDMASALYLGLTAYQMTRATTTAMRTRAKLLDEGKWTVLFACLCVAGVVLGALSVELHAAKTKSSWDVALASSTILLSWLFVAMVFAQQYAHSFYLHTGQLQFPGTPEPDYVDFAYFAAVLSMCCQTSDVVVTAGNMRRLVMLHSVVSFFFNVIIIAITVNVVAGVL